MRLMRLQCMIKIETTTTTKHKPHCSDSVPVPAAVKWHLTEMSSYGNTYGQILRTLLYSGLNPNVAAAKGEERCYPVHPTQRDERGLHIEPQRIQHIQITRRRIWIPVWYQWCHITCIQHHTSVQNKLLRGAIGRLSGWADAFPIEGCKFNLWIVMLKGSLLSLCQRSWRTAAAPMLVLDKMDQKTDLACWKLVFGSESDIQNTFFCFKGHFLSSCDWGPLCRRIIGRSLSNRGFKCPAEPLACLLCGSWDSHSSLTPHVLLLTNLQSLATYHNSMHNSLGFQSSYMHGTSPKYWESKT